MNDKPVGIIGDIILDRILSIDHFPRKGSEAFVTGGSERLGGSACNTARMIRKLGITPLLVACYADDEAGRQISERLNRHGLDRTYIKENGQKSGVIYILVTPDSERTMITSRSDNPIPLEASVYDALLERISWLHVSGYTLTEQSQKAIVHKVLEKANQMNITVSLDPGTGTVLNYASDLLQILPRVDYFLPNEEEYEILNKNTEFDKIIKRSGNPLIIKRGQKGARIRFSQSVKDIEPGRKVSVTDTTGAGDAFNAGFIARMVKSRDPETACSEANEAAGKWIESSADF